MDILTFDIEDWFHILDNDSTKTEQKWSGYEHRLHANTDRLFELLSEKKQSATFFCLGWIARRHPDIVKRIDSLGYEIGTHSDMHQLVYEQTLSEFVSDLDRSIKSIEDITGKKVSLYRAPGFSVSEKCKWIFEELVSRGIEIDSSIFPSRRAHGGFEDFGAAEPVIVDINGSKIKEFPISLTTFLRKDIIFSGGGYFRLFPYWLIRYFKKRSDYVMTYFHPRDFDPDQPMIEGLSLLRRFKSYYGLRSAFSKLERLIDDSEFVDIRTAEKMINWDSAKVVSL